MPHCSLSLIVFCKRIILSLTFTRVKGNKSAWFTLTLTNIEWHSITVTFCCCCFCCCPPPSCFLFLFLLLPLFHFKCFRAVCIHNIFWYFSNERFPWHSRYSSLTVNTTALCLMFKINMCT